MRKRRSTVFVRPGKDVTLYVPTETPPEVIDYLNRLKAQGMFSHGVMEIVTNHVLQSKTAAAGAEHPEPFGDSSVEGIRSASLDDRYDEDWSEKGQDPHRRPAAQEAAGDERHSELSDGLMGEPKKWSLEEIFRQARHNSGKLMND